VDQVHSGYARLSHVTWYPSKKKWEKFHENPIENHNFTSKTLPRAAFHRGELSTREKCKLQTTVLYYRHRDGIKKTFKSPSFSLSIKINSFVWSSRPVARPSPRMQSYRYIDRVRGKAICNDCDLCDRYDLCYVHSVF